MKNIIAKNIKRKTDPSGFPTASGSNMKPIIANRLCFFKADIKLNQIFPFYFSFLIRFFSTYRIHSLARLIPNRKPIVHGSRCLFVFLSSRFNKLLNSLFILFSKKIKERKGEKKEKEKSPLWKKEKILASILPFKEPYPIGNYSPIKQKPCYGYSTAWSLPTIAVPNPDLGFVFKYSSATTNVKSLFTYST